MAKLSIKIKGLEELKKKLNANGQKELLDDISMEMEIASNDIRNGAVSRVPVDQGFLRNSITVDGRDLKWIVYVGADYGAFQEFGTKTKVEVPPEMQEVANQFRNKKLSQGKFREAIAAWMRRKGIPDDAIFPIMAKIMRIGVNPKPFLYPSFKEVTTGDKVEKQIDSIIQSYLNK